MSRYTTEVRYICEQLSGLEGGVSKIDDIIEGARTKIFDFSYPIFDDDYKPIIEKKILMHYYTREIGLETYGLWKLKLMAKLNEIMPYYNKLYESELLYFNPFWDVDFTTEHEGEDKGTQNAVKQTGNQTIKDTVNNQHEVTDNKEHKVTDNTEHEVTDNANKENHEWNDKGDEWNLFSDTPQGGINGIENAYDGLDDNAYLTDARNIKNERDGEHKTNNKFDGDVVTDFDGDVVTDFDGDKEIDFVGKDTIGFNERVDDDVQHRNENKWEERVFGKRGGTSYSKMLQEFRETFLNIDMLIIKELSNLFFMLW